MEGEFKDKYSFESWEKEVKKDLNDKLCKSKDADYFLKLCFGGFCLFVLFLYLKFAFFFLPFLSLMCSLNCS